MKRRARGVKFLYEYRTKDNAVHSGVVSAADRDAAFAALKSRGIRPSRLTDAPGFFNHLFGRGKRWIAITALCALCLVLCALTLSISRQAQSTRHQAEEALSVFDAPTRRQIIGDAAVIEKGIASGWADVFDREGDRFLASFAIPGYPPALRTTTEAELRRVLEQNDTLASGRARSPSAPQTNNDNSTVHLHLSPTPDSLESRQIRAIVSGMKDELRRYLAKGGSVVGYGRRLVERQESEIGYYNRIKTELETAEKSGKPKGELLRLWEERNAKLRAMGIRPVPMPE